MLKAGPLEDFPFLYRYILLLFLKRLGWVLFAVYTVLLAAVFVFYLNQTKVFSLKTMVLYAFANLAVYPPLLFPILLVASLFLTVRHLLKGRLSFTIFTLGVGPKNFFLPFLGLGFLSSTLIGVYFQTVYPKAAYLEHTTYLESKKKKFQEGLIQNFWFKSFDNTFFYFKLVNLSEGKAYGGKLIKVDRNFKPLWFGSANEVSFRLRDGKVEIFIPEMVLYKPDRTEVVKNFKLIFPYDEKLLKVKKPEFFSLTELVKLSLLARQYGINPTIYVWELEKRVLVLFLTVWVLAYGFVHLLASIKEEELGRRTAQLSALVLIFYVAVFLFQTLVDKLSLNPLYGFLITLPYLAMLWKKGKD